MPVRYILSSVWVGLSIISQFSIIQYMGLCVFSLPISLVMIERICTLSYYHHQIGGMNYYPLFRVRSRNNGMRCMSLYILLNRMSNIDRDFVQTLEDRQRPHMGMFEMTSTCDPRTKTMVETEELRNRMVEEFLVMEAGMGVSDKQ